MHSAEDRLEHPAGKLEAIWIKRAHRGPMDPAKSALAVAGRGLEGSADQGGKRQVTLIDKTLWQEALRELGRTVEPSARRANLMVSGVSLTGQRGRILSIGEVRILVRGETRPCERMDEAAPGLRAALDPDWRAGAYGEVLVGGVLEVGAGVEWLDGDSAS